MIFFQCSIDEMEFWSWHLQEPTPEEENAGRAAALRRLEEEEGVIPEASEDDVMDWEQEFQMLADCIR